MAIKDILSRIIITAKDETAGVFDSLKNRVLSVAGLIAGFFGVKAAWGALENTADLEKGMSKVEAAAGASAEEMQALRAAAEEAGAMTKFTAAEAASGLEALVKAGLSSEQAISALTPALLLAQAGEVELGQASEYLTKAVNGLGMSFEESGRVADVLSLGANATMTSVDGLAQSLSYVAPIARSLGLDIEDTVTYLGKLADAGIDASRSGTALNNIMSQFSNPSSIFRKALADAGIVTNDFNQAMRELATKEGPAVDKAIQSIGLNAGPALRSLVNQGADAMDDLRTKLENAGGSAQRTADIMENNLHGATTSFSSALEGVRNKLLTPLLEPVTAQIRDLTARLRAAISDGTIERYGDILKTAFENAAAAFRQFLDNFSLSDFETSLKQLATGAGEAFTGIANFARNTGAAVKAASGVMIAGFNVVLTAVYGFGVAFSFITKNIQERLAAINEAFAKVTTGDLSERFAQTAQELRISAEATGEVLIAFGEKGQASMQAAVDGANMAREGFSGVFGVINNEAASAMDKAASAADASAAALQKLKDEAAATQQQIADLNKNYESFLNAGYSEGAEKARIQIIELEAKMQDLQAAMLETSTQSQSAAGGLDLVCTASDAAADEVKLLCDEYDRLMSQGDTQGAAAVADQIRQLGQNAQQAGRDVTAISEAMNRMGLQSDESLKQAAESAKQVYDEVRRVGGSARETQEAFVKYAKAAIDANNGVADAALRTQAQQHGIAIETDNAGKSVVKVADNAQQAGEAGKEMADGMKQAADATNETGEAAGSAGGIAAKMAQALDAEASSIAGLSSEAGAAVDALRQSGQSFQDITRGIEGLNAASLLAGDSISTAEKEVTEFGQQAQGAAAQAEGLRKTLVDTGLDWKPFKEQIIAMESFKEEILLAKQNLAKLDAEVERFNQSVDNNTLTLQQQEKQLIGLVDQAERYGSQQLSGLRSSLEAVRQKMISLRDDGQAMLDAINNERDQLTGNLAAAEERQQQAKIRELQAKLVEAQASGDKEAITLWQQAIAAQRDLQRMKIEEARTKEKEEKQQQRSTTDNSGGTSGGSSGGASAPSSNGGKQTIVFELAGKRIPVQAQSNDARSLVREFEKQKKVAAR